MKLFEGEAINISRIYTVAKYNSRTVILGSAAKYYNVCLPTYEFIFFVSGENATTFAGKAIKDEPNSVRYLPKGVKNGEYIVEKLQEGECIDIYFDTDCPMPDTPLGFKNMPGLKGLFQKLYNIWESKQDGYYAESMSLVYKIIAEFKKSEISYKKAPAAKLRDSYDYLISHFGESDFDYREMCAVSGLSYDYFKELFKSAYGMTPVKYVTAMRIGKAKELLITGQYTVTEIAAICGYENVYYFSSVFKKETGFTPTGYKSIT